MFGIDAPRLLVTVAETASFTKAAVRLNYTQSAVSRRIAPLEQRAGRCSNGRMPLAAGDVTRGERPNPDPVMADDQPDSPVGQGTRPWETQWQSIR